MKHSVNFLFLLSILWGGLASAQTGDTLFLNRILDADWIQKYPKNYPSSYDFEYLEFSDGSIVKKGDSVVIGFPSGNSNKFSYLVLGKAGFDYLPELWKGYSLPIENIKMSKNSIKVFVSMLLDYKYISIKVLDVSSAVKFGELVNPYANPTSEQALAELKRAKDKLDLGLISQSEYDKIKSELSKFIK